MKQQDTEYQSNQERTNEERPSLPIADKLTCGVGTFLAAGVVDLVAHLGPTGLVVGGIAAYVASQHGPELLEQVRGALSTRPSVSQQVQAPRTLASEKRGSKRSALDRALGRFPAASKETSPEDAEAVLVEELEETPRVASSRAFRPSVLPQIVRHSICLSPDLILEANGIVGAGINIFGVKGSGKTGAVARLAEQFARYRVSQVLFDIKGDLVSLVTDCRPDGRHFVPNGFAGGRGRAPRGRSVLANGLQAVYDLRTWQTPEQMASLICTVVEEMLETVALTPEGELAPCLVFLDEAEYWLPQSQPSYLSGHTYKRLLDAFHMLATMGRSRGLAPVIATQRIAKVNKDIIAQAEMNVLMKATLDIDLDRYYDYFNKSLVTRERIRGFAAGEAVVCLPDGSQSVTRLSERESRHLSHTPHITAGLRKFAGMRERGPLPVELDDDGAAAEIIPSADQSIRRVTAPPLVERPAQRQPTLVERAVVAYLEGATSQPKLAAALKISPWDARKLMPEVEAAVRRLQADEQS